MSSSSLHVVQTVYMGINNTFREFRHIGWQLLSVGSSVGSRLDAVRFLDKPKRRRGRGLKRHEERQICMPSRRDMQGSGDEG